MREPLSDSPAAPATQRPSRDPSTAVINDYTGYRSRWTAGAPTWQHAIPQRLSRYDLLFYGNNGEIEYDARIQPGADPQTIAFQSEGVERPRIAPSGDLDSARGPWDGDVA